MAKKAAGVDTDRKLACGHRPSSLKGGACAECPDLVLAPGEPKVAGLAPPKGRKGKKGKDKFELDHPDERDIAQTAVLKAVSNAEGKADPLVVGIDLEERVVTVSLRKLSGDGRRWLGVRFTWQKSDSSLHDKEGEEVGLKDVGLLDYISWLRDKPLSFLRKEAKRVGGSEPAGNQSEAVVAYLASLYQLELKKGEGQYEKLERMTERRKALADMELTESEYFDLSLAPDGDINQQLAEYRARRLATRKEMPEMNANDAVAQEIAEKRGAAEAVDIKQLKAAAKAKKAAKEENVKTNTAAQPTEEKATPEAAKPAAKKPAAKKAEPKKPAAKAAAKPERKVHKLGEFKEGMSVKYVAGRNKAYRGRTMKVQGLTDNGVLLKFGERIAPVSPNSLEIVKG